MLRKHESAGFWASGSSIFASQMAKEENARLAPLRSEIKAEGNPVRKAELKRQMAEIKAEFKTKRRNSACSLF
jgi:hypothetical protein